MKAFMSTGTLRGAILAGDLDSGADLDVCSARSAEREARRILAETEPETRYDPHFCRFGTHPDMEEALADALAAFVGEPCRCAGGIHWSAERGYWHCNGIRPVFGDAQ